VTRRGVRDVSSHEAASKEAPAVVELSSPTPVAPVASAPPAPPATETSPPAPLPSSATIQASLKPSVTIPTPATRQTSRAASPPRSSHSKRNACDPPYSIDSEGRQIFKPECM
jgi:eukaryotic-like serine/threonine-protein kinase